MVALAVHHGQAETCERKFAVGPSESKYIFRRPFVEPVSPIPMFGFIRFWRLLHERPGIVCFLEGPLHSSTYEINLSCAEEEVTACTSREEINHGLRFGSGVERGIDDQVKFPARDCTAELCPVASVAIKTFDVAGKIVRRLTAVEDGHVVSLLAERSDNARAKISGAADDECIHGSNRKSTTETQRHGEKQTARGFKQNL